MGYRFPSREWAEEYCRLLDSSQRYRSSGRGWRYPILFKVTDTNQGFTLYLDDGRCLGVEWYDDASSADAPVIISASLDEWIEVISGRINPLTAIMRRRLKIEKGDISLILRYSIAALEMVHVAQKLGLGSSGEGGGG